MDLRVSLVCMELFIPIIQGPVLLATLLAPIAIQLLLMLAYLAHLGTYLHSMKRVYVFRSAAEEILIWVIIVNKCK